MLSPERTALIVVDIQGKIARAMHDHETLIDDIEKLVRGAQALEIPIILTEQNPEGLGPTIPEISGLLASIEPVRKLCFNCCENERFLQELEKLNRRQLLLAGIEMHVCVYQTAAALLDAGYEVQVVADAVSSRTPQNKEIGLGKVREAGGSVTSVETALFELLRVAAGDKFKKILKIVK
jgi:nicotinamidase-related amidase